MATNTFCCVLLTFVLSTGSICASEDPGTNTGEFPTSSDGFPPGTDNHSDFETEEINDAESSRRGELSNVMESQLLRMLKLSSRPLASVGESFVPGYVMALRRAAADVGPASTLTSDDDDDDDQFTWAVKAVQGIYRFIYIHTYIHICLIQSWQNATCNINMDNKYNAQAQNCCLVYM